MTAQLALFRQPAQPAPAPLRFSGPAYAPALDAARLTNQIERIFALMSDGAWRSLAAIEAETGDPQASISAQLRHLRKPRFGGHGVERQRVAESGVWEYKLVPAWDGVGPAPDAEEEA